MYVHTVVTVPTSTNMCVCILHTLRIRVLYIQYICAVCFISLHVMGDLILPGEPLVRDYSKETLKYVHAQYSVHTYVHNPVYNNISLYTIHKIYGTYVRTYCMYVLHTVWSVSLHTVCALFLYVCTVHMHVHLFCCRRALTLHPKPWTSSTGSAHLF